MICTLEPFIWISMQMKVLAYCRSEPISTRLLMHPHGVVPIGAFHPSIRDPKQIIPGEHGEEMPAIILMH